MSRFIVTLTTQDRPGIVAAVAGALHQAGANIIDSAQFFDPAPGASAADGDGRFFMRVEIEAGARNSAESLSEALGDARVEFNLDLAIVPADRKARLIVMVSKFDHCLQDLLYRCRIGALNAQIMAIVSNHEDSAETAAFYGLPFHHWPVDPSNKPQQEARLLDLVEKTKADLVVLARYMQVLSNETSQALFSRAINIHHSFLPAFKGARPYQQAHDRGVKLIGATAHYVTPDLDEGPIIEQDAERVSHASTGRELVAKGRDIEARVLARAVRYHIERRVFVHGRKTVVFS
ncbi:MAG: formyltetrahydrofolate deformylase [Neomegalonema sp.]|nr:formyltetrahydrofolate deformylase [Neomegalonema sp.]